MSARLAWPIAVVLLFAAPAFSQEKYSSPLPDHLPLGVEACYGRAYDADEMRAHPKQRVASFMLFRDFTPDPSTEETPQTAEQLRENDGSGGSVPITALVQLRGGGGTVLSNTLFCSKGKDGVRCGVECDGGSIVLKPEKNGLLVQNNGFIVVGGCGDDADKPVFLTPNPDDRAFRLEKKPVEACTAIRDMQRPAWAKLGEPLRVRLARTETLCFSREYDAGHLAKHPQQTVKRIAVLKAAGPINDSVTELTFRAELRTGRKLTKKTTCYASKYAFSCTHNPDHDVAQDFYLTRAGGDQIMLRDTKSKLPQLFGAKLGSDDKTFRLNASPASACEF